MFLFFGEGDDSSLLVSSCTTPLPSPPSPLVFLFADAVGVYNIGGDPLPAVALPSLLFFLTVAAGLM